MAAKLCTTLIASETTATCICSSTPDIQSRTSLYPANPTARRRSGTLGVQYLCKVPFPAVRAASGPNSTEPTKPKSSVSSSTLQDELSYVAKLTIGSVLGAAVVKYGSAAIPVITKPNITQALAMIWTPVIIAVLLLLKESRKE